MPPSFIKHSKGIHKPHFTPHKPIFYVLEKPRSYVHFNANAPLRSLPPQPTSSVFDSNDCIWHFGTVYVKEATAVAKLHEVPKSIVHPPNANNNANININNANNNANINNANDDNDDNDDDAESVSSSISSGNPSAFKPPRSIAKQNQTKYLKHGMQLRHLVECDEWNAAFDADANRIIRTPDGVAFDTLRQFARLHHNEVLSADAFYSTNVWADPQFMYQDDADGQWRPLSNLKKK